MQLDDPRYHVEEEVVLAGPVGSDAVLALRERGPLRPECWVDRRELVDDAHEGVAVERLD